MTQARRTPLHTLHTDLGGKMVAFAGWDMPVQFAGIMAEHNACRTQAALFDVSHMCQVILRGANPAQALEKLVPAALTDLPNGKARYTFFTTDAGGILDDLIVSNAGDHLFVVVNASMRDQDLAHMRANLVGIEIQEITDHALIALQGPMAEAILAPHCAIATDLKFMETALASVAGVPCRVSRLGYTGEDGYEISVPEDKARALAETLLEHENCHPAGLGARDSLRLEAGLCLYGNDIDQTTSPVEANLSWAIQKRRRDAGGFPGENRIQEDLTNGPSRRLVGIKPHGRAPARGGTEIYADSTQIGAITSGGFGPTFGGPVAMGYVQSAFATPGTEVTLMIRGKPHMAEISALPFVPQNYKR